VEGLSALKQLQPGDFSRLYRDFQAVRATLFRLPHASREEVARCGDVLFEEIVWNNTLLEKQFVVDLLNAPVAICLGLRPLLVLMLLEGGRLERARAMMAWPAAEGTALAAPTSTETVASFLPSYAETRGRGTTLGLLVANFEKAFGRGAAAPDGCGCPGDGPLPVPRCQSVYACPSCPCRRYCRLDEWLRLARRLRARALPTRQEDLLERLAYLWSN